MDRPSSPPLPLVQGFTPINPSSPCVTLTETAAAAIPTNGGNKTGKKRPRKESKSKRATYPRQPKKAKQAAAFDNQDISTAFTVGKPHAENARTSASFPSGTVKELTGQKVIPYTNGLPETPQTDPSPGTVQAQSPLTNGLGSIYQAAFQQKEPQDSADRTALSISSRDHSNDSRNAIRPAAFEAFLLSSIVHTLEYASKTESRPDESPLDPVCEEPCFSGIVTDLEHVKADRVESPAMTAIFPSMEQGRVEPHDWSDLVRKIDMTASNAPEAAGFRGRNDCTGMETHRMDIDDSELSFSISQFINDQDEASEHSPEHLIDPVNISLSSDINAIASTSGDDVKLSSDTTFLVPSSPYLPSCLGQLPCTEKVEVSDKSFSALDQPAVDEDIYNDEDLEAGFLCLQNLQSAQMPPSSPLPPPKQEATTELRWVFSDSVSPVVSTVNETPPSKSPSGSTPLVSPAPALMTHPSKPEDVPWKVSFDEAGNPVPFVRCPYPARVRDRSPVFGLSSNTFLRTCFRIGEALNAGSTALRTRTDAVIELYARVLVSERPPGSLKQHFQFADIFCPDKPPFLRGTYGLWKGVELWDLDSKVLLGEKGKGKMVRVVGRMVRDEKTRVLELSMLSVWKADWEDVGICKGHYCG
ncbi:MAG: hypothetical protein LQ341_005619 [Variospora aurantia]|nr:MAG: hypothetical protein LQ341_005619 [Variospora aurantia]